MTLESEMDVETSAAIDRVSDHIDALDVSVNGRIDTLGMSVNRRIDALDVSVNDRIDALDASVNRRIDALDASVNRRIDVLDVSVNDRIAALEKEFRAELRDGFAEARRRAEVLFESLRDDIRMLADGFAHVSAKLDSLQR